MNEREKIERATAEAFLRFYNEKMGTDYLIIKHSGEPDIHCTDSKKNKLKLEITMTEDRIGDIQAGLGRSESKSLEALKTHITLVRQKKAHPFDRVSCLQGNVIQMLLNRIKNKLMRDYGVNTALVVRDTSGCDWDWSSVTDLITNELKELRNPFEKGIWIVSRDKNTIFRIF